MMLLKTVFHEPAMKKTMNVITFLTKSVTIAKLQAALNYSGQKTGALQFSGEPYFESDSGTNDAREKHRDHEQETIVRDEPDMASSQKQIPNMASVAIRMSYETDRPQSKRTMEKVTPTFAGRRSDLPIVREEIAIVQGGRWVLNNTTSAVVREASSGETARSKRMCRGFNEIEGSPEN
jgi:hypothetical protein